MHRSRIVCLVLSAVSVIGAQVTVRYLYGEPGYSWIQLWLIFGLTFAATIVADLLGRVARDGFLPVQVPEGEWWIYVNSSEGETVIGPGSWTHRFPKPIVRKGQKVPARHGWRVHFADGSYGSVLEGGYVGPYDLYLSDWLRNERRDTFEMKCVLVTEGSEITYALKLTLSYRWLIAPEETERYWRRFRYDLDGGGGLAEALLRSAMFVGEDTAKLRTSYPLDHAVREALGRIARENQIELVTCNLQIEREEATDPGGGPDPKDGKPEQSGPKRTVH